MNNIEEYLDKTESAVKKLLEAYNSYKNLLIIPKRPFYLGFIEDKEAFQKWNVENKMNIDERIKRDDKYSNEFLAITTLCGCILEFAFKGIKLCSNNTIISNILSDVIKPKSIASKFCVGQSYNDIPIGLVIFAGRNQAAHYDENPLRDPNKTIFNKMANWYSPRFKKWFTNSYLDLDNPDVIHYSENIIYYLN